MLKKEKVLFRLSFERARERERVGQLINEWWEVVRIVTTIGEATGGTAT